MNPRLPDVKPDPSNHMCCNETFKAWWPWPGLSLYSVTMERLQQHHPEEAQCLSVLFLDYEVCEDIKQAQRIAFLTQPDLESALQASVQETVRLVERYSKC